MMVFSDLDGTLIHYPDSIPDDNESLLKLPPSSTGLRGIVSSQTLKLTQELRRQGKKFVLISGMRTTTLLNRLPYLPKADAYCSEAGGRIFYPTDQMNEACFTIEPKSFQGATKEDLKPFGIVEDMDWRQQMEEYTGKFDMDGSSFQNIKSFVSTPVEDRASSKLWNYARYLRKKGYVIDVKGYSSCFRLNKKHQKDMSDDDFYSLIDKEALEKAGLATSVNLSCIDIYPAISGKKNWYVLTALLLPFVPLCLTNPTFVFTVVNTLEKSSFQTFQRLTFCRKIPFVYATMTMTLKWPRPSDTPLSLRSTLKQWKK